MKMRKNKFFGLFFRPRTIFGIVTVFFLFTQPGCLLVSFLGVQPESDVVALRQFVPRVALKAAEGWFLGCNAFLASRGMLETNCADQQGGEFFVLYFNAAFSAVRNLFPELIDNGHFYYKEKSVQACLDQVQWNVYWLTRLYLESSHVNGETIAGDDRLAQSTLIGVQGTNACDDRLVGGGRLIEIGGFSL
jgi:hypothetical protein